MFPKIGGKPRNRWFIRENPKKNWMIWGETPIFGNIHIPPHEQPLESSEIDLHNKHAPSKPCKRDREP